MTFLNEILAHKANEVRIQAANNALDGIKRLRKDLRDFTGALAQPGLQVIAEVKQRSPSLGIIRQDLQPAEIARMYEENGATAISVLTDNKYFGGELTHLEEVRNAVDLPVLRKDFIIDEYQVHESYCAGADALLLIADALPEERLVELYQLSCSIGLHVLVEAHSKVALRTLCKIKPRLAGLNSRDLATMRVDLEDLLARRRMLPEGSICVAESGISDPDDLLRVAQAGFDAALVGTALLNEGDPGENLKQLMMSLGSTETTE